MRPFTVRVPGKLLLAGEYAVLDGQPAIVAAIDRLLILRAQRLPEGRVELAAPQLGASAAGAWTPRGLRVCEPIPLPSPDGRSASPGFVASPCRTTRYGRGLAPRAARTSAARLGPGIGSQTLTLDAPPALRFLAAGADLAGRDAMARGAHPHGVRLDTESQLGAGADKLGLGASAAATVAAVLAVQRAADLTPPRERILRLSLAAHGAAQGKQGSGADVAASLCGGLLWYTAPQQPALAEYLAAPTPELIDRGLGESVQPLAPPPGFSLALVSAGPAVSTPERLERYRAWTHSHAADHERFLGEMSAATGALRAALATGDAALGLTALRGSGEALAIVEEGAGFPVWTAPFRAAARAAREHGCAAKPSGAGGGDAAVIVGFDPGALSAAVAACRAAGLRAEIVDLSPGASVEETV